MTPPLQRSRTHCWKFRWTFTRFGTAVFGPRTLGISSLHGMGSFVDMSFTCNGPGLTKGVYLTWFPFATCVKGISGNDLGPT